jgi:hypothetical protein
MKETDLVRSLGNAGMPVSSLALDVESIMDRPEPSTDNEQLLREAPNPGFFADFWDFLKTSKKWWLLPLLVVFLALGVVLVLAHTAAAPFIYTLF